MPLFRRPDGDLVQDVPAYRRAMQLMMRRRNESSVLFEQRIDARPALEMMSTWQSPTKLTFFHLVVRAIVRALAERPRLNRFTSGGRLYQRRGIWVAFSAKKAMNDDAPVVVVKQEFDARMTLAAQVEQMQGGVKVGRSDQRSTTDKELGVLFKLPHIVAGATFKLLERLDDWNLMPRAMIDSDPMHASVFVANLGSLKIDAAYHHNYEYGNIPIFVTIGQLSDVVVAHGGGTAVQKQIMLRWTYDERIEDGLYCARALDLIQGWLETPAELR